MNDNDNNTSTDTTAPVTNPTGEVITPLDFVIHVPDLRNGDAKNIVQAAPKASIAPEYRWTLIRGLPADRAIDAVEYLIRATYAQIMSTAGGTATDSEKSEMRKKAIIIGGVRAGAIASYKLQAADMNTKECVNGAYSYDNGRITSVMAGSTASVLYPIAQSMQSLSKIEEEAVGMMVFVGMAVPVLQGVSLVSTGHHFLPTTKNVFMGMKRQAMGVVRANTRTWLEGLGDVFDDMAFHKACHPISPPAKRIWAKDAKISTRLHLAGHSAAAIRCPAIPSDAAIGKTAIALAVAAKPTILNMGHDITIVHGPVLMDALSNAAEGLDERKAVEDIQAWAAGIAAQLAFCAGVIQAVHESTGTGRNTLLMAYSVKKLMAEHQQQVQIGQLYARASAQKIRDDLASGTFANPAISM